jgi:aspartate racemase
MPDLSPANIKDSQPGIIGIVGGVGPLAGLDLQAKIIEQTLAGRDQDYLPVISISRPGDIPDRTAFLLGRESVNPAYPILDQLRLLAAMGATVAGIPCNTAHASAIFDIIREGVGGFEKPFKLLHMIDETAGYIETQFPDLQAIGVLSTTGTWQTRLYPHALEPRGLRVIAPGDVLQSTVHAAVYDPAYGIKSCGRVTGQSREALIRAITFLCDRGAQAIILGCTELPLAFSEREFEGLPLVDPTMVLARALVQEIAPEQLK